MVSRWRQAFQQHGPEIFADQRDPKSRRKAQGYEPGESPDDLKKLIGELTVQNEILKKSERHCWGNEQTAQSGAGPHAVCAPHSPINKSQLARVLGIARSSLYVQGKRPKLDKALAVRIEEAHEKDDTMGHRKLAALLGTGKNRVKRVMRKYGIAARRKRKKYIYPGKATQIAPNKLREEGIDLKSLEVVFSDILEIKLTDGTRVRGCFALRHRTRQVLGIAFDYHMRAELVLEAIQTISFEVSDPIWHSDQGKQYGAAQTRELLLQKGFVLSMSRAGTPTDNGYAERFVGLFKLAVADRRPYHTLGQFLRAAEAWVNFYNQERPHEGIDNLSPLQYAQQHDLQDIPLFSL